MDQTREMLELGRRGFLEPALGKLTRAAEVAAVERVERLGELVCGSGGHCPRLSAGNDRRVN
jgi:hypothetical protein